ncbi:hypothetical protein L6164_029401 [Bauhinia variegata]|uniref:Uncharacterized protein n=1 Tax=Bauhinia variegata TaxID=167791 RepID=A0ACB9L906_BAUVA|nr:hypothetical protein L6164_029401 [Bauhinia variegata]
MGCRERVFFSEDETSSPSLCDALLFATMCIIGLPVDVHVKDGSVYSGIFHTASIDRDYGIVLKKARMTKKGKGKANVGKEDLIDTLLILSGDLVQVVAKGVVLPADGVGGNITGNDEAVVHTTFCSEVPTCEAEKTTGSLMDKKHTNQSRNKSHLNPLGNSLEIDSEKADEISLQKVKATSGSSINQRQVKDGDDKSKGQTDNCKQNFEFFKEEITDKNHSPSSNHEMLTCLTKVEATENENTHVTSKPPVIGLSCNYAPLSVKAGDHYERYVSEFKLNPAAKIFSPSSMNTNSANPTFSTVANIAYVPSSSPVVPVAAIQPEVGFNTFVSRPSVPVKVAQYGNLPIGNGGSSPQFSQPIVGQLAHRAQPLRYAGHYNPVLAEPAYLQPSSPAAMVGRSGQLVYVHPVSQDLVHGATGISPVTARPLSNLNHVQFPKQQGAAVGQPMPLGVPPPVFATGQQPFALQNHIPLLQPTFPAVRPIPVPGSNGFYSPKFP